MSREKFLKVYANIPINLRKDIILVLEEKGPITWDVAYVEIKNNTTLGKTILKKLEALGLI
ncbi:hypothetical protein GF343_02970 [Candidatus Woesearchaeota archaeon]|nr:hypothetical protein [Candidatus Woesearchaeota archaeon]